MSKPRSNSIPKSDEAFRVVHGFTTVLHYGKQSKHIPGSANFNDAKSPITTSIVRLQQLVEEKAGTGKWRGANKEVVDFGETIGRYVNPRTGVSVPTSKGTIHYSATGAHVVPAAP